MSGGMPTATLADEVSSVPPFGLIPRINPWRSVSLTTVCGLPRIPISRVSSRATRTPGSNVSATSVRHSRVKSSTTHRMRNRLLHVRVSETKSSDQRWFGPSGNTIGARVPKARLRPPRRRTRRFSFRYIRSSFLWLGVMPSRANK